MLHFIDGPSGTTEEVLPGVKAVKTGGHFPGSLVLHWEKKLFIADTVVTVPVSRNDLLPPLDSYLVIHTYLTLLLINKSPPLPLTLGLQAKQPTPSNGPYRT